MQNRCGRTQKLNRTLVACTTLSRVDILACLHALSQSLVETPRQIIFLSAPRAPKHQVFPVEKARRHEIQTLRRSGRATVTPSALSFVPASETDRAVATPPLSLEDNFEFLRRVQSCAAQIYHLRFEIQMPKKSGHRDARGRSNSSTKLVGRSTPVSQGKPFNSNLLHRDNANAPDSPRRHRAARNKPIPPTTTKTSQRSHAAFSYEASAPLNRANYSGPQLLSSSSAKDLLIAARISSREYCSHYDA